MVQWRGGTLWIPTIQFPSSPSTILTVDEEDAKPVPLQTFAIFTKISPRRLGNRMRQHGPWTIRGTQEVYRDPWIYLQVDQVIRPDGNAGTYCTVQLKPGVCVVAMDDKRAVYLTKEFHYAVGRITIEGVSGGIEEGESALITAERELKEELGITAKRFTSLGIVDPFTAAILSPTELFLAEDLSFGEGRPEGTEVIDMVKVPLETALQWVDDGTITHAPSCVALLKLARLHRS